MKEFIKIIVSAVFAVMILHACKEDGRHPYGADSTAPGKLTLDSTRNIPGGAVVWFSTPTDPDLLYVKAVYVSDRGDAREVKVSAVLDSLVIDGFGKSGDYTVQLYAVDRSENMSEAISVPIAPLTPPIQLIRPSLVMKPAYGGIEVSYTNDYRAEVSLNVTVWDTIVNKMVYRESFYTSQAAGAYNFRGYNSVKTKFGIYVEDRWGNLSDTAYYECVPIPDEYLDKTKFRAFKIAGDVDFSSYKSGSYNTAEMFDDIVNDQNNCGHTKQFNETGFPAYWTLDLGVNVKLSRFKLYQRTGSELYKHGNPKDFKVYGTLDVNSLPAYDAADPCKGWTFLKEFHSFKPSGLPVGQTTTEDLEFQIKGEDFEFDVNNLVEIRYLRFEFDAVWEGPTFYYLVIGELSFWGEILTK